MPTMQPIYKQWDRVLYCETKYIVLNYKYNTNRWYLYEISSISDKKDNIEENDIKPYICTMQYKIVSEKFVSDYLDDWRELHGSPFLWSVWFHQAVIKQSLPH